MRSLKNLLILTDHERHTENNSFYTLANAFLGQDEVQKVHVGSRGTTKNKGFFEGKGDARLVVREYKPNQDYFDLRDSWGRDTFYAALKDYDFILLRLPRPVPDAFFAFLERNFDPAFIVNKPSGIKKTGSKEFLLKFPELSVPMQMVRDPEEALLLSQEMDLVLKPLEEYGGKGLIKIKGEQFWKGNEKINKKELRTNFDDQHGMLAMKYLSRVSRGDKRIVVADGKIMLSTIRYPAKDSWLCNVAQGGSSQMATPSEHEKKIAEVLSPVLKNEGVVLYGFDTLLSDKGKRVLSEINTLSIGGIGPAELESGRKISPLITRRILKHLKEK